MGTFDVTLTGDPDGLPLLADWLRDDASSGVRSARIQPATPVEGQMGALSETLQVIVDAKFDVGAVAASIAVWLRSRRRTLTLEFGGSKGKQKVKVTASGMRSDDALVETLRTAIDGAAD
jgi:hypothetical protein